MRSSRVISTSFPHLEPGSVVGGGPLSGTRDGATPLVIGIQVWTPVTDDPGPPIDVATKGAIAATRLSSSRKFPRPANAVECGSRARFARSGTCAIALFPADP